MPGNISGTTDKRGSSSMSPCTDSSIWHLTAAYDGTDFHGYQIQSDVRTVQGEIQRRCRLLFGQPDLKLAASSRTDAGVHALGQHISFVIPRDNRYDSESIRQKLNRWLPEDAVVVRATEEHGNFHARYSAVGKAYTYVIHNAEACSPLFSKYLWRSPFPLDPAAMSQTAAYLEGEHDFTSFAANSGREIDSAVRRLHTVEVITEGPLICISVVGTSFLYKMVRGIVGYLAHVGAGRATPESVNHVLAARNRCAAAESAPPQGLFLAEVFFEENQRKKYSPLIPPFAYRPLAES